jgi:hypothetical protein
MPALQLGRKAGLLTLLVLLPWDCAGCGGGLAVDCTLSLSAYPAKFLISLRKINAIMADSQPTMADSHWLYKIKCVIMRIFLWQVWPINIVQLTP